MTELGAPRGIRNNNPGNIRADGTKWLGLTGDDGSFCKFDIPEHGIRAIGKILVHYLDAGVDTVEQIISRWAPPSENDTVAYINSVCQESGFSPNMPLLKNDIIKLIPAIIQHENGVQPYSNGQITSALVGVI